jgi:hypothetical protein
MIAFTHIEGSAIRSDGLDQGGNDDVRVGIAVAMGVGRKVIRGKIAADLPEGGDRFAAVARDSGSEVLRGFDAA